MLAFIVTARRLFIRTWQGCDLLLVLANATLEWGLALASLELRVAPLC